MTTLHDRSDKSRTFDLAEEARRWREEHRCESEGRLYWLNARIYARRLLPPDAQERVA